MNDTSSMNKQCSMKNVTPINEKENVQEQACMWVSRIDRGLCETEKQDLTVWVGDKEQHRTILFEMAALWDDLSVMHELSDLFPLAEKSPAPKKTGNRVTLLSMAASVAFISAVLLTWMLTSPQQAVPETIVQTKLVYQTGIGEQKTITLDDGSLLSLNTSSIVEVEFTSENRDIIISRGEAHFEVAPDATRPFVVTAGNNKVIAIGTAFNVQLLKDERFELLVTEGKVLVSEISQPMPQNISQLKSLDFEALGDILVSGDTGIFNGNKSESRSTLSLDQVQRNLSWQQGMLVFQGEPLEDALTEMNRYADIRFEIQDEALKSLRVAGYFKVGDSKGLLHALENNFQIEHHTVNNVIQLTVNSAK